ncbi:MAG: AraC family transcriptional regulator [Agathobaculum sp.]|uniref:helix-turn-helix domain-containing protein n=1 Tax=Agathobaculum sp. TaxID=2048138 RepID=UPI002A81ECB3|nr:AraC family transcriptional regulator [Agathobaculum sp.]MDY3712639.1 AraC family transcriptional regulator [Agathobaculum sp.]
MPQTIARRADGCCFGAEEQPQLAYASLWTYEKQQDTRPMHRHNGMCELLLTIEGNGIHTVDGQVYHTQRGDLLVYNAGIVHEDNIPPNGLERIYAVGVSGLRLPDRPPDFLLPHGVEVRLCTGSRFGEFEALFRLIYEHTAEPRRHSEEMSAHLLTALLLMVLQLGQETRESEQPESAQVNLMRGYIDTHYAEEISLECIAAQAGLSPYYASHLFKEYCGYSPMQYVIRRRIGEAQSLLLLTQRTVAQIAAQTGFDSPSHFSTIFSKYTGRSPSAYRKNFRQDGREDGEDVTQ